MANFKKYMTEENFKLLVDVIKMEGVDLLQARNENLNDDWGSGQTHTNPETLEMFSGNMECAFGEKWLEFRDKILQWKDTYEYESYSNEFSF